MNAFAEDTCANDSSLLEVVAAGPAADGPGHGRTLILLHGVSHGAWCWERHFLPYFAARGYRVLAPSLRGHGGSAGRERLDEFTLDDYVADLAAIVARQPEPPIVIGHSMGGALLQRYLQAPPQPVRAAVLLASMPPRGMLRSDLFLLMLRGLAGMRHYARLSQGPATARQVAAMPFFSHRLDAETAAWVAPRLQLESTRAIDELKRFAIAAPPPSLPPLLTVGSAGDWLFGRRAVTLTANFYGSERIVFDAPCHDLMLDPQWRDCAEAIDAWLMQIETR